MKIDRDAWLSDIFGYNVFSVSLTVPQSVSPSVLQSFSRSLLQSRSLSISPTERLSDSKTERLIEGRAFYYTKVPTDRVDLAQALSSAGFNVVDVNVTFIRRTTDGRPRTAVGGQELSVVVQDILPAHYDTILNIAASCFVYSRFHLDPEIPKEIANAIKRAWVDSYIQKARGERLLVGLLDGKPVGFLAVLATIFNGEPCRVIDLIGVDRAYQGCGVGKTLVSFFIEQHGDNGTLLRVGTQVANVPSMRLYESLGFRMAETTYVLHAHVNAKSDNEDRR